MLGPSFKNVSLPILFGFEPTTSASDGNCANHCAAAATMVSLDSLGWTFSPPIHFCDIFCKILPFGNWKCNSDSFSRLAHAPAHLHLGIHALTCISTSTHQHTYTCTWHTRTHTHAHTHALTRISLHLHSHSHSLHLKLNFCSSDQYFPVKLESKLETKCGSFWSWIDVLFNCDDSGIEVSFTT